MDTKTLVVIGIGVLVIGGIVYIKMQRDADAAAQAAAAAQPQSGPGSPGVGAAIGGAIGGAIGSIGAAVGGVVDVFLALDNQGRQQPNRTA